MSVIIPITPAAKFMVCFGIAVFGVLNATGIGAKEREAAGKARVAATQTEFSKSNGSLEKEDKAAKTEARTE